LKFFPTSCNLFWGAFNALRCCSSSFQYVSPLPFGNRLHSCCFFAWELHIKEAKAFSKDKMARNASHLWTGTRDFSSPDANLDGNSAFL
jgi:hypothetical protein